MQLPSFLESLEFFSLFFYIFFATVIRFFHPLLSSIFFIHFFIHYSHPLFAIFFIHQVSTFLSTVSIHIFHPLFHLLFSSFFSSIFNPLIHFFIHFFIHFSCRVFHPFLIHFFIHFFHSPFHPISCMYHPFSTSNSTYFFHLLSSTFIQFFILFHQILN